MFLKIPFHFGAEDVGAGSIIKLDHDRQQDSPFCSEISLDSRKCILIGGRFRDDTTVRWFAEF